MRSTFSSQCPGLQKLDLSAASILPGQESTTEWKHSAQKKDTEKEITVVYPTHYAVKALNLQGRTWRNTIGDGPNHFEVIIKAADPDV
jgi:hypothetical protein